MISARKAIRFMTPPARWSSARISPSAAEEAVAKLRAGMYLEVRESSLSLNAAAMAAALRGRGYLPNVTLCSDDVTPEDLLRKGHIDYVARRLVEEGLDPVDVLRFATLNAANRLRRSDLGALAPGRIADVTLLSSLHDFTAEEVYRAGRRVASRGQVDYPATYQSGSASGDTQENTVHLPPNLSAGSFRIRPAGIEQDGPVRVRVINWHPRESMKTSFRTIEAEARAGELQVPAEADGATLNTLAVVDRYAIHGGVTAAVLRGFGLRAGALASTVSHDCHQLTVVGADREDMLLACRRLAEIGGGIVLVLEGEVLAEIPLPVAGLVSLDPVEEVAERVSRFRQAATRVGLPADNSFMGIVSLTLAVSPEAKLSDLGLVDVNAQTLIPMVVT